MKRPATRDVDDEQRESAGHDDAEQASDRIRAVVDGDEGSLEWLVEWLSPLMLSWARTHAGAGAATTAEDLVQDVWARVLPELRQLRPHPASGRWTPALLGLVRRTLRNRVIDVRRSAIRRRLTAAPDGAPPAEWPRADSSSGPVSKALRSERRQLLQEALDRLTDRERALYVDRIFDEASIDELAAQFGMTPAAVIKARQRVRQRLSACLAPRLLDELDAP